MRIAHLIIYYSDNLLNTVSFTLKLKMFSNFYAISITSITFVTVFMQLYVIYLIKKVSTTAMQEYRQFLYFIAVDFFVNSDSYQHF